MQGGQEGKRPFSKALACFTAVAMFGERLSTLVISNSTPRKLTFPLLVLPPPAAPALDHRSSALRRHQPERRSRRVQRTILSQSLPPSCHLLLSHLVNPLALASHPGFPSQSPPLPSFLQRFSLAMARQQAVEIQSLQANATDAPGEPRSPTTVSSRCRSRSFFLLGPWGRGIGTGEEVESLGWARCGARCGRRRPWTHFGDDTLLREARDTNTEGRGERRRRSGGLAREERSL